VKDFLVERDVPVDHFLDRELGPHPLARGLCDAACRVGIVEQLMGQPRDGGTIPHGEEVAGLAVRDEIPIPWDVGHDHRHFGQHRFHQRVGLSFVRAGQPETVEVRKEVWNVGAMPKKVHSIGDFNVPAPPFQDGTLGSVADDYEMGIGADDLEKLRGPNQVAIVLLRPQSADRPDQTCPVR